MYSKDRIEEELKVYDSTNLLVKRPQYLAILRADNYIYGLTMQEKKKQKENFCLKLIILQIIMEILLTS